MDIKDGEELNVTLHDGSHLLIKKLGRDYNPLDKLGAISAIHKSRERQELITGLLYINPKHPDLATLMNVTDRPLVELTEKDLDPGPEALKKIMNGLR